MKLNFFSRLYLAITDFRLYPFIVQKEKLITAFAYLLTLLIFVSLFLSTSMAVHVFEWSRDFTASYISKVPEFVIEDGILIAENNVNFEFKQVRVYMDSTESINNVNISRFNNDTYDFSIIALKDGVVIGKEDSVLSAIKYGDIIPNTDKMEFFRLYNETMNKPAARVIFTGVLFVGIYVANICTKVINIIGISIMLLFLGVVFRVKYKFADYMKVACYVVTLPIIIETIALVVTGARQDYVNITYYLLMYIYMYYAIRALKLDNIIMTTKSKIIGFQDEVLANHTPDSETSKEKTDSTGDELKKEEKEDNK